MSPQGRGRDLDEDDIPFRAGRPSRARTRQRPTHDDAVTAVVTAVDRGRFRCRESAGEPFTAVRGGELRRTPLVVGDEVQAVRAAPSGPGGDGGDLARLVRRMPRRSVLHRSPDDIDPIERPVVANAELLVVVTSATDPPPNLGFVDRCLVAGLDGGLAVALCVTKTDLGDAPGLLVRYTGLALTVVRTRPDQPLDTLRSLLAARTSVLIGPSGAGKSSLVNRLVPGSARAVGIVGATGLGRHTSSSAVLLDLPGGGHLIDTPGLRSFGLGSVSAERLLAAFPDLLPATQHCPPGCSHLAEAGPGAPRCGLDRPGVPAGRVASLRRLLTARTGGAPAEPSTSTVTTP